LASNKVKNPPKDYIGDNTYGASLTKEYLMNLQLIYQFDPNTGTTTRSYFYSTDRIFMKEYIKFVSPADAAAIAARIQFEWNWVKTNVSYFSSPQSLIQRFIPNAQAPE